MANKYNSTVQNPTFCFREVSLVCAAALQVVPARPKTGTPSSEPRIPVRVLDIGCGTGLAGLNIKKTAQHLEMDLVGVDLSPRMLAIASATGAYQDLLVRDARYLPRSWSDQFDVVIASSSIQFFPEPKLLFEGVHRVLKPGGHFAFTFDVNNQRPQASLTKSGYYAFNRSYIEAACKASGLIIETNVPAILRREPRRGEINGYITVSRKGLSTP